jgi:catalase-peroxidase
LIAGGHTFGKAHGAASPKMSAPNPREQGLEEQGLGWKNKFGTGNAGDTITSGLEGAWTNSRRRSGPTDISTICSDTNGS